VLNDDGTIIQISPADNFDITEVQQFSGALVPGFINCHTHLELSFLKNKIARGGGLTHFILDLLAKREADQDIIQQAIHDADIEMYDNGIVAVGDIANTSDTILQKLKSRLYYHTFIETLGYREDKAEAIFNEAVSLLQDYKQAKLKAVIAPHAPYSLSRALWEHISLYISLTTDICSIHMAESNEELNYCYDGSGTMNKILEFLKYEEDTFTPFGMRSLQAVWPYIEHAKQTLLVHNTFLNQVDFDFISESKHKIWLCTCPNANLFIEKVMPDYKLWLKNTSQICIGTDSLASNDRLSIWDEILTIHKLYPDLEFNVLLSWATLNGAKALCIDSQYGSIEINKKPGVVLLEYHPAQETVWDARVKRII
jgi:cytosine/adenosine deaminase-related metal-dependent hydrolase